jgi:hypothetical protein
MSMHGRPQLSIIPLLVAAAICCAGLHLSAAPSSADGVPVVDQTQGGLCVNGSVPGPAGCTGPVNTGYYNAAYNYNSNCYPRCPLYNPITGGYANPYWTQNYWYPNDWNNYWGTSWLYCTWPGGGGWYLSGSTPAGAYCS